MKGHSIRKVEYKSWRIAASKREGWQTLLAVGGLNRNYAMAHPALGGRAAADGEDDIYARAARWIRHAFCRIEGPRLCANCAKRRPVGGLT